MNTFNELPEEIQSHFNSHEVYRSEEEIITRLSLDDSQGDALVDIINKVALKETPLSEFQKVVEGGLHVDAQIASQIVDHIVTSHFSHFPDFYSMPTSQNIPQPQPTQPVPSTPTLTVPEGTYPHADLPSDSIVHDLHKGLPSPEHTTPKMEYGVDSIVASLNVSLTDDVLKKRLYNVVDSRLREVRTPDQFKEILGRPVKVGGLGLPKDQIDSIVASVEKEAQTFQENVKIDRPKEGVSIAQVRLPTSTKRAEPLPSIQVNPVVVDQVAPAPQLSSVPPQVIPQAPIITPQPTPQPPPSFPQVTRTVQESVPGILSKPVMQDVRKEGAPLNLVDEISLIDINEFRRVGESTKERIALITGKVDSLAKESYSKRIAAIEAWRKSPLYAMYVELGSSSLETGSVDQTIVAYASAGKQTLTKEEFEAITDLNQSLSTST